ncbi:HlyD family type I secretion periplasmic adaptor subunit [unidentified bacterial endosymbiont]|uniref:HlyD family type I secretion periplasmic adaptor subunit n=1 Tax=unidentified bacterial endosymbiont TaxID=2355 RepID=UPI00209E14F7|nr:HlyD family type I secretion periplasmic adaptor subunit [unidentified bacterial endosymbiont]
MRARLQRWYHAWRDKVRPQDHYEFLPAYLELMERPPSPSARMTAAVVVCSVLITIVWAWFGQLDMHVVAAGELVLPSRSQEIQSYSTSEVVAIHVRNGQSVKAGDPLLTLNNVGTEQDLQLYQEKLVHQQLDMACYQALLNDDPQWKLVKPIAAPESLVVKNRAYCLSVWQHYRSEITEAEAALAKNDSDQAARRADIQVLKKLQENHQQRLAAYRQLAASQAQSRDTLLRQESELLSTERELTQQVSALATLKAERLSLQERRSNFIAKNRREWHEQLKRLANSLPEVEQGLEKALEHKRLQVLRAPLDGMVQKLVVYTIGGIVKPAETLLLITPLDAAQRAEVRIDNKDIGFIRPGEEVTIKVDAFPYSRYGTLQGTVLSLSRDAIPRERNDGMGSQSFFPAQIELKQNHITVDNQEVLLTAGMSIQANIKVGKRRVIDYVFSPIREYQAEAWREP